MGSRVRGPIVFGWSLSTSPPTNILSHNILFILYFIISYSLKLLYLLKGYFLLLKYHCEILPYNQKKYIVTRFWIYTRIKPSTIQAGYTIILQRNNNKTKQNNPDLKKPRKCIP